MKPYWPIQTWRTITTYIDMDTGEVITKQIAKQHYTIHHKSKYETFNYNRTKGWRHFTIFCRAKQLQELPFTTQTPT